MTEVRASERHNILNNHKNFNEETLCFWYVKINDRLNYLAPLIKELKIMKLDINIVSKDLSQEIYEITELNKLLGLYKIP